MTLEAGEGPIGTSDYRIVRRGHAGGRGRTFMRLVVLVRVRHGRRGWRCRRTSRTVGRDKVGFTVVGKEADGEPRFVGGMRGVVERNTMRYYLAIEAYLGALSAPPRARMEKSLRDWFAATERYPRQTARSGARGVSLR